MKHVCFLDLTPKKNVCFLCCDNSFKIPNSLKCDFRCLANGYGACLRKIWTVSYDLIELFKIYI